MICECRKMLESDRDDVLNLMRTFYSSDAVFTNGNEKIFQADFDNSVNNSPFLEGFVFLDKNKIIGYSMLAKSFSTEFGKECIWIEDLYLIVNYRSLGIIPNFINFIKQLYPDKILRLEAEKENEHAIHVYEKTNFKILPYLEYYYLPEN